jgi:hypothetical protein
MIRRAALSALARGRRTGFSVLAGLRRRVTLSPASSAVNASPTTQAGGVSLHHHHRHHHQHHHHYRHHRLPHSAISRRCISSADYAKLHGESLSDPEGFWARQAADIVWDVPCDAAAGGRVLDSNDAPFYKWFPGGRLNMCYNAVDRHVDEGRGDQVALYYDSPVTGVKQKFTFKELQANVARLAGAIAAQGVQPGDRVLVYMPMVPEVRLTPQPRVDPLECEQLTAEWRRRMAAKRCFKGVRPGPLARVPVCQTIPHRSPLSLTYVASLCLFVSL